MIKFIHALVSITFVASEALNSEEQKELIDFHNIKRGSVKPSATNMLEMVYSKELENLAVDWVARCKFEHPNWKEHPKYSGTGQNLALSGGSSRNLVAQATGWWNEVAYYTYANNTCASGKVCGHYTQVVWASSGELGCAVQRCDNIKPDWPKPIFLMACQYKPPGNFAGTKPYTSGDTCSQCPHGTTCVNKLLFQGRSPNNDYKDCTE
ncbi:GLI patholocus tagsis 1 glioma [Echinococcus multilocularis]|uniref:GLI patholocus tagsis 1 glioma n=1 Tax=Echinococcus multilocularis TaxID=6211 RepID=A0A068Y3H7_ECHMU|nr:GLI patholocus tagsis 1 glioma [Echinococcus multilocularis]